MNKVIELKNISFSYKKNQIFEDFSVDFYEKKISFLLGKNGSGKTTLLKLLNGFLEPDMGDVYINGKKLHTYSQQYLSKTISYVPQNINAADGFSVLDYLVLRYCQMLWIEVWIGIGLSDFLQHTIFKFHVLGHKVKLFKAFQSSPTFFCLPTEFKSHGFCGLCRSVALC